MEIVYSPGYLTRNTTDLASYMFFTTTHFSTNDQYTWGTHDSGFNDFDKAVFDWFFHITGILSRMSISIIKSRRERCPFIIV